MTRYIIVFGLFVPMILVSCSKKVTGPAEPFQIEWERIYGGKLYDSGACVRQTNDGGFVIVGSYGGSYGGGWSDVYLIKTDRYGNALWEKTYGPRGTHIGESVQEMSDGGFIIAGQTNVYGSHNTNVYLIKTDQFGDTVWTRSIGGDSLEIGYGVAQTSDGGYIVVGWTWELHFGALLLLKTSRKGHVEWKKLIDGPYSDYARAIEKTPDGYYMVTGSTSINGNYDLLLMKISDSGEILWLNTFGGRFADGGYSVCCTRDGGFAAVGYTETDEYNWRETYLVKIDCDGNLVWESTFGGGYSDCGYCVQSTADGGFIIGCENQVNNEYRAKIIKTDRNGNELWSGIYGDSESEFIQSIQPIDYGGFIATGCKAGDVWLFKIE